MESEMTPPARPARPVVGEVLSKGRYTISRAVDDRLRELAGAGPRLGNDAHAGFTLVMAIGGIGLPVREVFAKCGLEFDTGAVLAQCAMEWDRPLAVGREYQVKASLLALDRKASRRFGAADHLRLSFDIDDDEGRCARVTTTTIVPAAESASA